ncbi:MAG: hypothetical protein PVSMB4_18080 [Ktedonobacterales bacterium]
MTDTAMGSSGGTTARLRLPRVGELAPDFTLPATDGGTVHLAEYPRPVALVFLRHLA